MPAPAHYKVIFSGVFGSAAAPVEEWSFGLSFASGGGPFLVRGDLGTLNADMNSAYANLLPVITSNAILTRIRTVAIGTNGKYEREASGAYVLSDLAVSVPGGGGGVQMPTQVAMAVSLDTDFDGPTGRGRFYLPAPAAGTLEADGRMSATGTTAKATAVAAFVQRINQEIRERSANSNVVVASGGSPSKALPPALHIVRDVKVGRALDTQRRRRGDLQEAYAKVAVTF